MGITIPVLRTVEARSRRDLGERTSTCLGSLTCPSTSTGTGKSADDSRPAHRSSVTTSGRASPIGSTPGSITTASPDRRPDGTAITSPLRSRSSDAAASARFEELFCFDSAFSRSVTRRRSAAYSVKSPRWQLIASAYPSSASRLRSIRRASPTTDRSAWNCANDCSSRSRAFEAPRACTRLTAML